MIPSNYTDKDIRRETLALVAACGVQGVPIVKVRWTAKSYTTGRCTGKRRIHLSVPKGASVPQVLTLIAHEVAHYVAPKDAEHGDGWRMAFARCLKHYEVDVELSPGTKRDADTQARQALADRLRLPQAGIADAMPDGPVVEVDSSKRDAVLRKVAGCLQLAAYSHSEAEASTAALTASRLLRTYRLSLEDVTASERDRSDPLTSIFVCMGSKKRVYWRSQLGFDLASALGTSALSCGYCQAQIHKDEHEAKKRLHATAWHASMQVFGRRSAVMVYEYLYTYLLAEIDSLGVEATKAWKKKESPVSPASPRVWGASFREGIVRTVCERIRKDYRESPVANGGESSTAITIVDRDLHEAEAYCHVEVPNIGAASYSGGSTDRGALSAGREAGHSIAIRRPVPGARGGQKLLGGSS